MEQNSNHRSISVSSDKDVWNVCGYLMPKLEVVYFSQIIILYIVIIVCLLNLSIQHSEVELWCSLLSASIGYLLPNPSLKKEKIILQKINI
jgi:hypothetical protein